MHFTRYYTSLRIWDSVTVIVTMPQAAVSGVSSKLSELPLGPYGFLFNGYQHSFPTVKQPGHKANDLSPSSVEVRNDWNYISAPPVYLHGMHNVLMFSHQS